MASLIRAPTSIGRLLTELVLELEGPGSEADDDIAVTGVVWTVVLLELDEPSGDDIFYNFAANRL